MKFRHITLPIFLLLIAGMLSVASAQKNNIKDLITSKRFVFNAQTALPLTGRMVQLTSSYDLTVKGDSLISYLPYYGRAYNIDYGSIDQGLNFTSTNFDYKIKERKKGGWDITITPTDTRRGVRAIYMTVSENGYGTIQVEINERQNISFTGYVTAAK